MAQRLVANTRENGLDHQLPLDVSSKSNAAHLHLVLTGAELCQNPILARS